MIEIKDVLEKFNKIIENEEIKKTLIIESIKDVLKINIKKEQIEIKNNILYLKIKPIYKNEIFFNKEKIISNLNNLIKNKKINKIL